MADPVRKFVCPDCNKTFLTATGLGSHRRTHGVAGSSTHKKKTDTPAAAAVYPCPECGRVLPSSSELGKHRRAKHGVLGQNKQRLLAKRAAKLQQQQQLAKPGTRPYEKRNSPNGSEIATAEAVNGHHEPTTLDPLAYAIAVGSVKEFCRNFAEEHGIPTRQFTRQFAELFLREARR